MRGCGDIRKPDPAAEMGVDEIHGQAQAARQLPSGRWSGRSEQLLPRQTQLTKPEHARQQKLQLLLKPFLTTAAVLDDSLEMTKQRSDCCIVLEQLLFEFNVAHAACIRIVEERAAGTRHAILNLAGHAWTEEDGEGAPRHNGIDGAAVASPLVEYQESIVIHTDAAPVDEIILAAV